MARMTRLLGAVSLGVAVTAAVGAAVVAVESNPVRRAPAHVGEAAGSGRVIVKFKERSSILSASNSSTTSAAAATGPQKAAVLGSRLGLKLTDGRILGERTQVLKTEGMNSSALAAAVANDADVEWVEVDRRRFIQAAPVNDALYPDNLGSSAAPNGPVSGQWYLRTPNATTLASIDVEPAWAITKGSTSIVIGDIDTGITSHPDLNSKILAGYDFISDAPTANDGGGRDADPSDPGDFVTAAENSNKTGAFFGCNDNGTGAAVAENSSWHGTQTAGILGAATNNSLGMAGTAYSVQVVPARALGKCGGYDSDIVVAAQWLGGISVGGLTANAHPVRAINMSLGSQGACTNTYRDALTALRNKGVVVVAAAGNDEGLPVGTPANCQPYGSDSDQTPIVIAVAGLRHAGTKVGFSDIGPEVMIAAPGGNCVNASGACLYPILTTTNTGTTSPVAATYSDGLNNPSLGTSFATPLVTGTVALMLSANPALTNADVVRILKSTARTFPTTSDTGVVPVCTAPTSGSAAQDECICTTGTCGAGMLDAGAAVAKVWTEAGGSIVAPTAAITASATTVQVPNTLTLSGAGSTTSSTGAAITAYGWSVDNTAIATLSATSGTGITLTAVAAGTATVTLTITDADGHTATATKAITVTAAATPGGGSGGGGGGGAANPAWLAALALAGLLLRPRKRA